MNSALRKIAAYLGMSLLALIVFACALFIWGFWYDSWSGYSASLYISDGICNVGVFDVTGDIVPYHEEGEYTSTTPADARAFFEKLANDPDVKAVLVRIDSLGGTPAASLTIAQLLAASPVPVVALVGDYGTSGAYLVASAADRIIASPFSDIGSIGITMSYIDETEQNKENGLKYVPLTSAPYKDYGSPDKELTAEERALLERDLSVYHKIFVDEVAKNRGLSADAVAPLADGSSMPASLAKEHQLVDTIGGIAEAKSALAELAGIAPEEVALCE
jgi:protease-4